MRVAESCAVTARVFVAAAPPLAGPDAAWLLPVELPAAAVRAPELGYADAAVVRLPELEQPASATAPIASIVTALMHRRVDVVWFI